MKPVVKLSKSTRKNKKWMVEHPDGSKTHFGDDRYKDFTQHQDEKRKELYLARHKKNEDWEDEYTAGFWSRHLLWNKPSLKEAIKDIEERFKIKIDVV